MNLDSYSIFDKGAKAILQGEENIFILFCLLFDLLLQAVLE